MGKNLKSLIVGPVKAKRFVSSEDIFSAIIGRSPRHHDSSTMLAERTSKVADFILKVDMEADGAKVIDVEMKNLKLFMGVDALYIM
mmetsp:Transcript_10931/g.16600  ORF Transcript_10931/g.16600 Transcript_10931/m.16600 type:complete len:86 (+) Transcript_10931:2789-3046(+)